MRLFKKKVEFVSKEEFGTVMNNVTVVLEGMQVAARQQAQMLATIAKQLAQVSKKPQEEKKEEVERDVSIQ